MLWLQICKNQNLKKTTSKSTHQRENEKSLVKVRCSKKKNYRSSLNYQLKTKCIGSFGLTNIIVIFCEKNIIIYLDRESLVSKSKQSIVPVYFIKYLKRKVRLNNNKKFPHLIRKLILISIKKYVYLKVNIIKTVVNLSNRFPFICRLIP